MHCVCSNLYCGGFILFCNVCVCVCVCVSMCVCGVCVCVYVWSVVCVCVCVVWVCVWCVSVCVWCGRARVCMCVGFVMCGCFDMYTVPWLRCFLPWLRFLLPWQVFPRFFLSYKGKCQGKTRKDGTRPAPFQISCYLYSMYCLCVNVSCNTATGWQPNCS